MRKILIVTDLHPVFMEELDKMGIEYLYSPKITKKEAMDILGDYEGLVVRTQFPIDEELLIRGTKLEFIGRAGAGLDNIDLNFTQKRNIFCLNAPEGNRDAVAEHEIGMILSLANHLVKGQEEIRKGIWDREGNRGFELGGKVLGIIGMGNTGQALAKKIRGFDMKILGYDLYESGFGNEYIQESTLKEIFEQVDILSLHIPLTHLTNKMVNYEFLSRFQKPILFMNTSRGEIVETKDLLQSLREGKVIGAGLDVLESEKFPATKNLDWFEELINLKQVILSPHVAGWTRESYYKISMVLADKIKKFYQSKA